VFTRKNYPSFCYYLIDSYENNLYLEKTLVKKGFFVVSIDDHLRDHFSNIVVNNRFEESNSYNKISNQVWLTGSKYILITGKVKKTKEVKHKLKKPRCKTGFKLRYILGLSKKN